MAWIVLIVVALIDAAWQLPLNIPTGMDTLLAELAGLLLANAAIYLLTRPLKGLPVGAAFADFTGSGAIGISMNEVLALSGECRARAALEHGADLTGIVALKLLKT